MADEKLSQLPSGTAIADADLSYWDQSAASVSQPASAISTYTNSKLPLGSATQRGIVEVDGTTITALAGTISAVQPSGANPSATAGPAAVNGVATTFLRSDAAPAVQKASASQFGIVEVDGTSITASAGVISATSTASTGANPTATAGPTAVNGSATTFMRSDAAPAVQKASAAQFGIVEVDGTTITATGGVISASGGGLTLAAANITFFVATTGSDSNPGTSGSPFLTLGHALKAVAQFDYVGTWSWTINIANGTYPEATGFYMPQVARPIVQGGNILGNATTPANVIFSNSAGFIFTPATYQINIGGFTQNMNASAAFGPAFLVGMGAGVAGEEGGFTFVADIIIGETSPGTYLSTPFVAGGGALIDHNGIANVTFTMTQAINILYVESGGVIAFDIGDVNFIFPASFTLFNVFMVMQSAGQIAWVPLSITNSPGGGVQGGGGAFLTTANGLVTDIPGSVYFADSPFYIRSLASGGADDSGNIVTVTNAGSLTPTLVPSGTWNVWKDTTNGPRQIAMTDGGVTYTTQIGNFINAQTGTSYTLALFDQEGIVQMSNASANTLTVPTNASVAFPIGTKIFVVQQGAGVTTIAAAGGVTLNGAGALTGQFESALLYKSATNTWTQINAGGGGASLPGPPFPPAGGNLTFFVSTTGSDSNPGSSGSPFRTIQHGVDVLASFDYGGSFSGTLNVAAGTYTLGSSGEGTPIRLPPVYNNGNPLHGNSILNGAGVSSTIIDDSVAQSGGFLAQGPLSTSWTIQNVLIDTPSAAITCGGTGVIGSAIGVGDFNFEDTTASGTGVIFDVEDGGEIDFFSASMTASSPFQNFLLIGNNEAKFAMGGNTITLPSSPFGSGSGAWVSSDQTGTSLLVAFSITFVHESSFQGAQIIADGNGFTSLNTDNNLPSDFPGVASANVITNNVVWGGVNSVAVGLSAPGKGLFQFTKDTAQATGYGNYIQVNDAGTAVSVGKIGKFLVSALPAGKAAGTEAWATDAVAPVFAATLTGSGAVFCPVYFDGTNWRAG